MNRTLFRLLVAGWLGLMLAAGAALTQAPNPQPPARAADRTKRAIEAPSERLVAADTDAPAAAGDALVNPRVAPGKVRWHPDFDTACRAAAQSGKPVLLFQMMGRLDQKFC